MSRCVCVSWRKGERRQFELNKVPLEGCRLMKNQSQRGTRDNVDVLMVRGRIVEWEIGPLFPPNQLIWRASSGRGSHGHSFSDGNSPIYFHVASFFFFPSPSQSLIRFSNLAHLSMARFIRTHANTQIYARIDTSLLASRFHLPIVDMRGRLS